MFRCEVSPDIFTAILHNERKYTAMLHTETSNKRFIIQLNLFSTFVSNLKENYKCNRMSARTVLYNNQLFNIVGYLYLFRALSVNYYSWIIIRYIIKITKLYTR